MPTFDVRGKVIFSVCLPPGGGGGGVVSQSLVPGCFPASGPMSFSGGGGVHWSCLGRVHQSGKGSPPQPTGQGYPPSEERVMLYCGRYASCSHVGLSCLFINLTSSLRPCNQSFANFMYVEHRGLNMGVYPGLCFHVLFRGYPSPVTGPAPLKTELGGVPPPRASDVMLRPVRLMRLGRMICFIKFINLTSSLRPCNQSFANLTYVEHRGCLHIIPVLLCEGVLPGK